MKINLPKHCVIEVNDSSIENLKQIQLLLHENGYRWLSGISLLSKYYPGTKQFILTNKSVTWSTGTDRMGHKIYINYKTLFKTLLILKSLYED
jgi:hypothetical protein